MRALNGWQRLWLVATCLGLLWAVVYALSDAYKVWPTQWDIERSLKLELANPACAAYTVEPIASLGEPVFSEDGSTCYHIFNWREGSASGETPYTFEVYEKDEAARKMGQFWFGAGMLVGLTVFLSALLYAAGMIVAWIRRGFSG